MTTNLDALLTELYVIVDDHVVEPERPRPGRPKRLTDAELVCLAVAQVLLGARSEHHWLRMCYGRLRHLFPYLPKQPGYHKRIKAAAALINTAMLYLAAQCPSWDDDLRLVDGTPIPCAASRETVKRSQLAGIANYGYCAAHSRWFWGLKLYLITTPEGMPVAWCLADPKLGEREVAAELFAHARDIGALREDDRAGRQGACPAPNWSATAPTNWACCWYARTARTSSNAVTATSPGCANGSKPSTTPARTNSISKDTAAALSQVSTHASPSDYSHSLPWSGTTGRSTPTSNDRSSHTTTDPGGNHSSRQASPDTGKVVGGGPVRAVGAARRGASACRHGDDRHNQKGFH